MGKYEKLNPVGQCPVCTINLYEIDGKTQPQVMPCGIGGDARKPGTDNQHVKRELSDDCPHESEQQRMAIEYSYDRMIKDMHSPRE